MGLLLRLLVVARCYEKIVVLKVGRPRVTVVVLVLARSRETVGGGVWDVNIKKARFAEKIASTEGP